MVSCFGEHFTAVRGALSAPKIGLATNLFHTDQTRDGLLAIERAARHAELIQNAQRADGLARGGAVF